MKRAFILYFLMFFQFHLLAQITLLREGIFITNTETGTWYGDNIPRSVPTVFTYRNNSITSVNFDGYMLQAGDEVVGGTNNNLDGEIITGNKFTWNGTNMTSITHGIFTGHNINAVIKYNYLEKVPMAIIRKSNGMTNTAGGVAYNIVRNPNTGIVVKGMNNVNIYNNTFYSERTTSDTYRGLIDIYTNTDVTPYGSSTGSKIYNNIFYTKHQIVNIFVYDNSSLVGFESDYNVFYCEDGTPMFKYLGTFKTFAQWQALGFDTHSRVVNPNFTSFTTLVPSARLDFGTNLGAEWQTGLSATAQWIVGTSPATANQNGAWQVGARLYQRISVTGISVTGTDGANTITTDNGSLQLSAGITPDDATDKTITWSIANGVGLATITSAGLVTAIANGNVTVRATANDGSGTIGEIVLTITNQKILIENISIIDTLANDTIMGIGTKLALKASINPSNATDQSISWSVESLTGKANIDANGLLTTISQGTINVVVKANDGSQSYSLKQYIIAIPVTAQNLLHQDNFRIFPNPTLDKIQIQTDKMPSRGIIVKIMNINGQVLEKKRVFESITEWSVAQFSGKILLINVTSETGSSTKKIIVVPKLK